MTVAERLQAYLEARLSGAPSDQLRKALVQDADQLFEAIRRARQPFDMLWYANQRFMDGDHWLTFDRESGKVTNLAVSTDAAGTKIRRTINLMKAIIRGLKNFVLKVPPTVEVSPQPASDDPEDVQAAEAEAKQKSAVWRALEYKLKLAELRRPVVDDGFLKHAGHIAVLPTPDGLVSVKHYDAYDVFPDQTAPSYYDGTLLFLATRQKVQELKRDPAYENTAELKGDGRLAASVFKNSYEQSRSGSQQELSQGDLETVILKQLFIKFPYTIKEETDPTTGEARQTLSQYDSGYRIWIVSFTTQDLHKVEETDFKRWPTVRYVPEQTGNRVHGNAWATDLQDPNRTVDNLMSKAEEWHLKASPKLLVPSDSKLKEVTNVTAEVLEYDARRPDGIKDYMPSGIPASLFSLIDRSQGFASDVGGIHPATAGSVPVGVKSGRGIESLQSADAEFNLAEPMENFAEFWQEVAERVFDVIGENTVHPVELQYPDNGAMRSVKFMGQAGLTMKDGSTVEPPEGVVVIGKTHVTVRAVPEVSYSEEGRRDTLMELYKVGAIDVRTLLEAYRFSNVAEIVERVLKERALAAKMPAPPKVDPAKLISALSDLVKAGEPIDQSQIEAALEKAGLPPAAPVVPPAPPPI